MPGVLPTSFTILSKIVASDLVHVAIVYACHRSKFALKLARTDPTQLWNDYLVHFHVLGALIVIAISSQIFKFQIATSLSPPTANGGMSTSRISLVI